MSPVHAVTDETPEIPGDGNADPLQQLNQLQAIIQMEQELTRVIEKAQPWIESSRRTARHTAADTNDSATPKEDDSVLYHNGARVRPVPTTLAQVDALLALARTYAHRTSAPPGWIATAPVLHFSTPSPLPHQLRHGALAALQLQRALQQQKQQHAAARAAAQRAVEPEVPAAPEEPAVEVEAAPHPSSAKTQLHHAPTAMPQAQLPPPPKRPRQEITMNLSDDSSSEDDDE